MLSPKLLDLLRELKKNTNQKNMFLKGNLAENILQEAFSRFLKSQLKLQKLKLRLLCILSDILTPHIY